MSKHSSILVIDDQKLICNLMNKVITKIYKNITVKCIISEKDVFEEIKSNDYDLVFMDINLGKGVEKCINVLKKIKEIKPEQNIYMMTGYIIEEKLKNEIGKYSLGILRKPFKLSDVTRIINNTIEIE